MLSYFLEVLGKKEELSIYSFFFFLIRYSTLPIKIQLSLNF